MPLRRVDAIVLRSYRVGEADKIVVFLTLELGKIRGIAKAARRPRSRFGASLEVGTEIELTFFEKEGRELVSVDRCDIVRSGFSHWGEPILATTLGYITDLTDAFVLEREPNKRLYRLLRKTLFSLDEGASAETRARYFEAWLLRLSGLYPWRQTCSICGKPLAEKGGARFVVEDRRLGCPECLDRGVLLSVDSLRFLEKIWKLPPEEVSPPAAAHVLRELGALHYRMVQVNLEKELRSHQILEEMLRREARRSEN